MDKCAICGEDIRQDNVTGWWIHDDRVMPRHDAQPEYTANPGVMKTININDYVKVKLTPYGRAILENKHLYIPEEDVEGYSSWQLWVLFEIFEGHVGLGRTLPFETGLVLQEQ